MTEPLECPFCGETPLLEPVGSTRGNAWGSVRCINEDCPAQPEVMDGETVADDRGTRAYQDAAIERWNYWRNLK